MFVRKRPFGERSFEREKQKLKGDWSEYYFNKLSFAENSLLPSTYMIIGRKGSGKSSLAEYFKYQKRFKSAYCIHVDDPKYFSDPLNKIAKNLIDDNERAIQYFIEVWRYTIWEGIFKFVEHRKSGSSSGSEIFDSAVIGEILRGLIDKWILEDSTDLISMIRKNVRNGNFKEKQIESLSYLRRKPLIIAIDTNEHYPLVNSPALLVLAALIEYAAMENLETAHKGLHLKVFVPDEVFTLISESTIRNSDKSIIDPVFMRWSPKELMKLVCWRLIKHLNENRSEYDKINDVEWSSARVVKNVIWKKYFGDKILNANGIEEDVLAYIMRHTQLRPRQMMMICNSIASLSENEFPYFNQAKIVEAIKNIERSLADGIVNSYSRVFAGAGSIAEAISGSPMMFKGSYLDRIARRRASEWSSPRFSRQDFKNLMVTLGIVGRLRNRRETRIGHSILEADFEFFTDGKLYINESDICVIHPMFYKKYNIKKTEGIVVYPFPDHPDYEILD